MEQLRSIVVGTVGLELALLVAVVLAFARTPRGDVGARERAVRLLLLGVVAQTLHFLEELATGFRERFPALRGLPPWSVEFFVTFNVTWLVAWTAAALELRRDVRAAWVAAWFFVLVGIGNMIVHPLCSVAVGGYFPGLVTSPLVGVAGLLLWQRLWQLTTVDGTGGRA